MKQLNKISIQKSFSQSAENYAEEAEVQYYLAQRLIKMFRSELTPFDHPVSILDAGCGSRFNALLPVPAHQLIALDIAMDMLKKICQHKSTAHNHSLLCADLEHIPLQKESIDIVFSNATLHWCPSPSQVLIEFQRILQPRGLVLLSSYGPQTLHELRCSWQGIDASPHTLEFITAQQLRKLFMENGFEVLGHCQQREVVLYKDVMGLLGSLKKLGARNMHPDRLRGLSSSKKISAMIKQYTQRYSMQGRIPASFELLFFVCKKHNGHTCKPSAIRLCPNK